MKRNRKVKILATLGPASSDEQMIQKLHEAGADLFRINMSHASHDVMRTLVQRIRTVESRCGRPIGILADLQGPKLRVGKFAEGKVDLKVGQTFTLDADTTLGGKDRAGIAAERHQPVARRCVGTVLQVMSDLDVRIQRAEEGVGNRQPGDPDVVAARHHRGQPQLGGNGRRGGDVAAGPQVFCQGRRDEGVELEASQIEHHVSACGPASL